MSYEMKAVLGCLGTVVVAFGLPVVFIEFRLWRERRQWRKFERDLENRHRKP